MRDVSKQRLWGSLTRKLGNKQKGEITRCSRSKWEGQASPRGKPGEKAGKNRGKSGEKAGKTRGKSISSRGNGWRDATKVQGNSNASRGAGKCSNKWMSSGKTQTKERGNFAKVDPTEVQSFKRSCSYQLLGGKEFGCSAEEAVGKSVISCKIIICVCVWVCYYFILVGYCEQMNEVSNEKWICGGNTLFESSEEVLPCLCWMCTAHAVCRTWMELPVPWWWDWCQILSSQPIILRTELKMAEWDWKSSFREVNGCFPSDPELRLKCKQFCFQLDPKCSSIPMI